MTGNGVVKAVFAFGLVAAVMTAWGVVRTEGATSCNNVASAFTPCGGYLMGNAITPAPGCCPSLKALDSQVRDTPDRQAVCNCLKDQAKTFGVNLGKAAYLPTLCKINDINVPLSLDVDCTNYVCQLTVPSTVL